jgi:hypothetical protein
MRSSWDGYGCGASQAKNNVAAAAPKSCSRMKAGTSRGRMPAKVFVRQRATVTAGFAKDVEEVKQYAPVMCAPMA